MDGPVLIDDGVAGRCEGASQRRLLIQRFAVLLEGDDAQPVGACNGAGIRWQGAGQQFQRVVLPLPLGPRSPIRSPGPSRNSRSVTIGFPSSDLPSLVATRSCLDFRPDAVKS